MCENISVRPGRRCDCSVEMDIQGTRCEIRQHERHTHAHRPWPTSSACGPFNRRNVAGFDSGTSSMTLSSLLARATRGGSTSLSTWQAVVWGDAAR